MMQSILYLLSLVVIIKANERSLDAILRDGNNKLTANMFTEVVRENPDKNLVLSAFSVLTPLAQLALASVGESHDELLASIGMPNDNVTVAVVLKANSDLESINGITLKTASKIYVAKNYELNSDFADLTRGLFGSEVANVDFTQNEEAADEVNRWVEDQTNHRIKNLIDPLSLDDSTRALLVNTIYFKGAWAIPFDKDATRDRDFFVNNKENIKIPTMRNLDRYNYIYSLELDARVLELNYAGGDFALYIVLPDDIKGTRNLEEKLQDPSLLDNVIEKMYDTKVEVYLPKFKIETTIDLKAVLENINVKRLFNPYEARLDNLLKTADDLYISDAKQKAFIEVNEAGTEAAAANVFGPAGSSLVIDTRPKLLFIADRPFVFVLKRKSLTLFSGVFTGK